MKPLKLLPATALLILYVSFVSAQKQPAYVQLLGTEKKTAKIYGTPLKADFNGDNQPDFAIILQEESGKKELSLYIVYSSASGYLKQILGPLPDKSNLKVSPAGTRGISKLSVAHNLNGLLVSCDSYQALFEFDTKGLKFILDTKVLANEPQASLGIAQPLKIGHNMPYVHVRIGQGEGDFLVDFATDTTVVDLNALAVPIAPAVSNPRSYDIKIGDDVYTPPFIYRQCFCGIATGNVTQAGILSTDILSKKIFTLDFQYKLLYSVDQGKLFYTDEQLKANGFLPASTGRYYSHDRRKNLDTSENIPTVPVSINGVTGICQLDPGFDDAAFRYSVNINKAFVDSLRKKGIHAEEVPNSRFLLTTCKVGVSDTVYRVNITEGAVFTVIGTNGENALVKKDIAVFVKSAAAQTRSCGGISSSMKPAAQIGLSILSEVPQIIFDPFTSRVWFKQRQ
jgi:hypothetical protein